MKIRIKDNSVRYRLTQSNVQQLAETGFICKLTQFINRTFIYAIESVDDADLSAAFIDNSIILKMPKTMIELLNNSDKVGFDGQSGKLNLLVEKDFTCLDNTLEDQSDNYPNPKSIC